MLLFAVGPAIAEGEKLVLVGSGEPDPKDIPLIEHLEEWGYVVEPHQHLAKHPVNLADIDFVFISESPPARISWVLTKIQQSQSSMQRRGHTMIWDLRQTAHSIPIQATT